MLKGIRSKCIPAAMGQYYKETSLRFQNISKMFLYRENCWRKQLLQILQQLQQMEKLIRWTTITYQPNVLR